MKNYRIVVLASLTLSAFYANANTGNHVSTENSCVDNILASVALYTDQISMDVSSIWTPEIRADMGSLKGEVIESNAGPTNRP
jgi:hypothetical protein